MRFLLSLFLIALCSLPALAVENNNLCSTSSMLDAQKKSLELFQDKQFGAANVYLERTYTECPKLSEAFYYKGDNRTSEQKREDDIHIQFMHDLMRTRLYAEKYEGCLEIGEMLFDRSTKRVPRKTLDAMKSILATCRQRASRNCSDNAIKKGLFWEVDPEALYLFTQSIVDAFEKRDMAAFRSHIKGDLGNGPRNRYLDGKKLSDIFDEDFRDTVLEYGATCYVHSWRGIAMSNSSIWIQWSSQKTFTISGVWESFPEKFYRDDMPTGWTVNGKLLTPDRFSRPDMANENYSSLATKLSLKDSEAIATTPGKFLTAMKGHTVIAGEYENLSLLRRATANPEHKEKRRSNGVIHFESNAEEYPIRCSYQILADIPTEFCQSLALNFSGKCIQSYLVETGDETGGSMGTIVNIGIYGLFEMPDKSKVIAPLIHFTTDTAARNYLEDNNLAPKLSKKANN